jgi:hypothetical protein
MEYRTFNEAKDFITTMEKWLEEEKVHPYSIVDCLENFGTSEFHVVVDVLPLPNDQFRGPGHYYFKTSDRDAPTLILLRCGLFDRLSKDVLDRIKFWKWEDPLVWAMERVTWRNERYSVVNAAKRDEEHRDMLEYATLKRKWDTLAKSFNSTLTKEKEAKRQRTDEEILKAREDRTGGFIV